MCVIGFASDEPIDIAIDQPSGERIRTLATISGSIGREGLPAFREYQDSAADPLAGDELRGVVTSPEDDMAKLRWIFPASYEAGAYRFRAVQGDITTTSTIEVSSTTSPFIEPLDENYAQWGEPYLNQRGDTLRFALSGFAPSARVPVAVYRARDPVNSTVYELHRELEAVTVDQNGSAIFELPLDGRFEPDDRSYCLDTPLIPEHRCLSTELMFTIDS